MTMNPKLLSTTIVLTLSAFMAGLFLLNDDGGGIGNGSNYDFTAGPILVPLYGLHSIPEFTAQAILALFVVWICVHQAIVKSGLSRLLLAFGAVCTWSVSGIYTLALAYA